MAFLFNKFQEAVKVLARSPTFTRDPRKLQFEADINRLFLYTSYKRLGRDAEEADAEEIIEMASKASLADQEKQVQENIQDQIRNFCCSMDEILLPNNMKKNRPLELGLQENDAPRQSGLSFAVGAKGPRLTKRPAVPETKPLSSSEVSLRIKDLIGYTLDVKTSQIPHEDAGRGLYLDGEADVGAVVAFYPGIIYSPAYYRYIPGYPRVDAQNSYLITRYDGTVINAQPWGSGGESREIWDGSLAPDVRYETEGTDKGADRLWKMLNRPIQASKGMNTGEILELRNPLAFGHFANHPAKGMTPNVMICPYDFPLTEKGMRPYIPNLAFGNHEEASMRRFGSFWFRTGGSKNGGSHVRMLKALVLVATRTLQNEELLLNYRLSNSKRRPSWYCPVDEEEDRRRWS